MQAFLDAIMAGASGEEIGAIPVPESYRAALVRKEEAEMFAGIPSAEKDPTKSIHVDQDPSSHDDAMLANNQRIWGFESNFGGLADLTVVRANQLMPKPAHLSWEEAACNALCNSTSYRMLVSHNGANMKQGDVVLIWGASGGLGGYAVQYVLNGGGIPVGVVSSADKVELLHELGCDAVIDRKAAGYKFWK